MGKVYDALQRAEQQRAQRVEDASASEAPLQPPSLQESPAPRVGLPVGARDRGLGLPPPTFWDRLRRRSKAAVEEDGGASNKRRIAILQPESFVAEQFRSLRGRIDSIAVSQPTRTLAVASALPGDGKTFAAISLAAVTSMNLGRRVLLVDCDLRKPSVGQSLGLRVDAGLAEVLEGRAKLEEAISRVEGANLDVLPVRSIPQNPSELLAAAEMRKLLEDLARRYDRVVVDLPPTLGLPDAKVVSEQCDGIIFVVRADQTPAEDVASALDVLDRRRILGMILNDSSASTASLYRY